MSRIVGMKPENESILARNLLQTLFEHSSDIQDVRVEYLVMSGYAQFGKGDILTVTPEAVNIYELKYIDRVASGKTAKVKRTKQRKKVREQALAYTAFARLRPEFEHRCVNGWAK